ncbi:MAG TPA: S41 family peptidase [Anaerolineae bacterium]|nr:S41 family peptidase [Anaerolineae bacterium]
MERGTRNLLYGLLMVIVVVAAGSTMYVVGLNAGRSQSAAPVAAIVSPTPDAPSPTPLPGTPTAAPGLDDGSIAEELGIFHEVYDLIQSEFFGEIPSDNEIVYGAIRGMLQRLDDQNTTFLEPSIAELDREARTGTYGGIGALVNLSESQALEIVRIFKGSPAEQEGMRAGDQVIAVDDRSIVGLSLDEMVALVRGPAGSGVKLTVVRSGVEEPFDVVVTRAQIEIPLVESRMIGSDIAYINLTQFDGAATEQLTQEIESLLARNPKSLILDLRGNPGGFLDEAINVADLFLDEGVVMTERERDGVEDVYRSDDGDLAEEIPLVVLVDGGSASASEIVAGAVQDRDRGTLIGTLTFGKGSVQRIHTLSDNSELRVTIARWFTPNDRAIHGEGLEPDIVVEPGEDTATDPQLDRAIELLRTGK